MAKMIYDGECKDLSKKVYIELDDGTRQHFPFFDIKIYDGERVTQMKCWKPQKEMDAYFKSKDADK